MAHERSAALPDPPVPSNKPAAQAAHSEAGLFDPVVQHFSSASPQSGRVMLNRAERILETARTSGRQVSVEIVLRMQQGWAWVRI